MDSAAARSIPVFVVVPPQTLLIDIAGPLEVLRYANQEQSALRFDYRYVSPRAEQPTTIGLALTGLAPLPDTVPHDAYVLISGSSYIAGDGQADEQRREIVAWLRRSVTPQTTLVTICSGALLAADAGLLEGHDCTTHGDCIDDLTRLAPTARVLENRLYVEDGKRFSSAGISTGIDLMLHIVGQLTSPMVALAIARRMVLYMRRSGGDPQLSPFLSGRNHMHPAIHRVQDAIVGDPARRWTTAELADVGHLSHRHLTRLFGAHTNLSISDYLNLIRITLARELVQNTRLDMEAVAERAGFASPRHMRRVWAEHHGHPPSRERRGPSVGVGEQKKPEGAVPSGVSLL